MACFDYGESYMNSYNVYREKADEVAKSKDILDLYLPSVLKKILKQAQDHSHFGILSVGSGDGEIDRHIIKTIQGNLRDHEEFKNTKVFNRALEPNPDFVSQYKERLMKDVLNEADDDQTKYEVLQKTFQEYMQSRWKSLHQEDPIKFDIVHFVHCIFFAAGSNDLEETLAHCFEHELKENGQIVCIHSEFISRNIVPKLWGDGQPSGESLPEQIMRIADKRGWKVDLHKHEYYIDVTEVFDDESRKGNLVLDFFTRVKNSRATLEKGKVVESLQLIRDFSTVRDGKYLIENILGDVFFLSANPNCLKRE